MNGKWTLRTPALLLTFGALLPAVAAAQAPWARLMSSNNVEAKEGQTYRLKEENGPWMIMACSFSGDGADKQADELVLELRKRYKLDAYAHDMHFKLDDPNDPNRGARGPVRWQYKRFKDRPELYKDGAIKEIAVVVGNFPAVDDPDAQRVLEKIKSADPDCLNPEKQKEQSRTLAALRYMQEQVQGVLPESVQGRKHRGPLAHAFITTNPLLPPDYYSPKGGVDELVLRMNKGVTHSLLDCRGKYTVKVATFGGTVELDQRKIQEIQNGDKSLKSSLSSAAEMAHELTEALHMKGYDAYEFHDRVESIVTVGSFNSVGTPRPDGKTEINPQILAIMKVFGVAPETNGQQSDGRSVEVKHLAGIPFDYQPVPVEVPKRSISRELVRRLDPGE